MGKISVHALRGAYQLLHLQEQNEEISNICLGLFRSTMGYPCQHEMRRRRRSRPMVPLSFNDLVQHLWLVQPPPPNVEDVVLPSMETALKRIADDYDEFEGYRKRMLLERVFSVSNDVVVSDPVRAEPRGRPTGSTRHLPSTFELANAADNPAPLQRCGRCSQAGHNARTCHTVLNVYVEQVDNLEVAKVKIKPFLHTWQQ